MTIASCYKLGHLYSDHHCTAIVPVITLVAYAPLSLASHSPTTDVAAPVPSFQLKHKLAGSATMTLIDSGSTGKATILDVVKKDRLVDLSLKLELVNIYMENNDSRTPKKTICHIIPFSCCLYFAIQMRKRPAQKDLEVHQTVNTIVEIVFGAESSSFHAHEMWIAIERLQHGESLNIQDVKTNLFWEFGRFTSHDGESMESYYSRFYVDPT
ncbi:hypothetical protein Tco_0835790 [Tanacetum coccineum]